MTGNAGAWCHMDRYIRGRSGLGISCAGFFLLSSVRGFKGGFSCGLRRRRWRPMTVEEMKSVDVRTVDRDSLVDVTQVRIDEGLTKEERLKEFVRQVGNPYCFRVGSIVVKNVYSGDGVSLRERFEQFAKTL